MAETFLDGEEQSSIRQKINAMVGEVNTTRRTWSSNYVGSKCTYNGVDYDLPSGGNSKLQPGSSGATWVAQTSDESTAWKTGNTKTRVTALLDSVGLTVPLVLRTGGTASVDPNGSFGPANWATDYPGVVIFNSNLAPYYPTGQLVFHNGRLYTMARYYSVPPTQGTDENWRDVFADASVGNEDTSGTDQGGTGTNTGSSSDGAATSWSFTKIDASTYNDTLSGSSGQTWEKTTAVSGYGGAGVARTIGSAASVSEGAYITLSGFGADNTADRKVWIRCKAVSASDWFAAASRGNGETGLISANSTSWEWRQLPQVHKQYDASFRVIGGSAGMAIDTIILTSVSNTTTPTGKDGFQSA